MTKAAGSADWFTNPFLGECGVITACTIKVAGCASDYAGSNLVIDASTGEVTAKQNVDPGYIETVCISC